MGDLNLSVGQKVLLKDGRSAIVRFKGSTSFAPGEWIGVEFADAIGKNDGSVQDTRYFDCAPGHGMFLRATAIAEIEKTEDVVKSSVPSKRMSGNVATKSRSSSIGLKPLTSATSIRGRQNIVTSPTPSARLGSSRVSQAREDRG